MDSDEEVDEPQEDDPFRRWRGGPHSGEAALLPVVAGVEPSSPPACDGIRVTVRWGDYTVGEHAADDDGEPDNESRSRPRRVWQRAPQERTIEVPLSGSSSLPRVIPVPDSGGLELPAWSDRCPPPGSTGGSRRILAPSRSSSSTIAFRTRSIADRVTPSRRGSKRAPRCRSSRGPTCAPGIGWDEQVADLHYADTRSSLLAMASRPTGISSMGVPSAADSVDPDGRSRADRNGRTSTGSSSGWRCLVPSRTEPPRRRALATR